MWGRNLLVTAQVALSLMLLTVATFTYRTFQQELHGGIGFRPGHIAMISFDVGLSIGDEPARAFYSKLLAGAPALTRCFRRARLDDSDVLCRNRDHRTRGLSSAAGSKRNRVDTSRVSDFYFDVMDVKILRGRAIDANDTAGVPRVAVINEAAARRIGPIRIDRQAFSIRQPLV